jgi:OOP family OmpA-OmpF porin
MRKNLIGVLCTVGLMALSGCTFKAAADANAGEAEPPPPAPAPTAQPVAAKPEPKKKFRFPKLKFNVNAKGEVELPGPVLFEVGTANLKPESDAVLDVVFKYLEAKPDVTKLRVEGHTDTDGGDAANVTLSTNRAKAVAAWLTAKGTDCKRLVPVGFGETKLLKSPEATADDKAQNRRVMFINAEIKDKAIGGLPLDGGGTGAGDPCQ